MVKQTHSSKQAMLFFFLPCVRFVVLAADAQVARSILLYKDTQDKIAHLADNKALACAGPQSDCVSFTEYISKNMALYELNNDVKLTTKAAATFIRGEVCKISYCCTGIPVCSILTCKWSSRLL